MVASVHSVQMSHIIFYVEYNVMFYNIILKKKTFKWSGLVHDKSLTNVLLNSEFVCRESC